MALLPLWMKRVWGRLVGGPARCEPAQSVDALWRDFMASPALRNILEATGPRQLPYRLEDWQGPLETATRLYRELEKEGLDDLPAVYPVLSLLFKGTYLMQRYGKEGPKRLFEEEVSTNFLLHAAASGTKNVVCPAGYMTKLAAKHPGQLEERVNGQTPLCKVLESSKICPDLVIAMLEANGRAAGIPYHGVFPLHQACRRGYLWSKGLKAIFEGAPHALHESSSSTPHAFPPFGLVAMAHADSQEAQDLSLLRSNACRGDSSFCRLPPLALTRHDKACERQVQVVDTLFNLLKQDPTVVKDLNVPASPAMLW